LGRWTAADPIGLGDGINRFAYASGRPTALADPGGTRAFAPGDPDDPKSLGEVDSNYGTGFSAEDQRGLDTSAGDATPTHGRPISEKYAEERAIAEVEAAFIEEYVGILSADYEARLREADAERMHADRRTVEQLGGFHPKGRVVSDFEPGQVRGASRVEAHASDLRALARRLHALPFADRLVALEARNEQAVAGIDWRGDTVEDLLLFDAALGMGGVTANSRPRLRSTVVRRDDGPGRPRYVPRDESGNALPLPRTTGGEPASLSQYPHTQVGTRTGSRVGQYHQSRRFDEGGRVENRIDWTDHGRAGHADPHVHDAIPNPSGGTPRIGPARLPRPKDFR